MGHPGYNYNNPLAEISEVYKPIRGDPGDGAA
jgi:hypothetical protein